METEILKSESGVKGIDELFQSVQEFATSARFKELLNFTAHFKQYAPYNAMLIYIQRPGARFVLPPRWLELCRARQSATGAAGNLLMLAPTAWPYLPGEKKMTRLDACVLNRLAQLIAGPGAVEIIYKGTQPAQIDARMREAVME